MHMLLGKYIMLVILAAMVAECQVDPDIPYNDCGGSDHDQIASIRLTGCEEDEICRIKMGDTLTLTAKWKTYQPQITKLESTLFISFFHGFKKEVDISPFDACDYLKCPIRKDAYVDYTANFTVPSKNQILPGEGRIWWYGFQNKFSDPLLCVNFQVIILRNETVSRKQVFS